MPNSNPNPDPVSSGGTLIYGLSTSFGVAVLARPHPNPNPDLDPDPNRRAATGLVHCVLPPAKVPTLTPTQTQTQTLTGPYGKAMARAVSYTHLRAHET